jgi:hypothetical protein
MQNMTFSSQHRRYSEGIPRYLWDRPKAFVVHCMEKLYSSEYATETDVERVAEKKGWVFNVRSSANSKRWYNVDFGDESHLPHCSCYEFVTKLWPCKHFFAAMRCADGCSWNTLPVRYREHPMCILDRDVVGKEEAREEGSPQSPCP